MKKLPAVTEKLSFPKVKVDLGRSKTESVRTSFALSSEAIAELASLATSPKKIIDLVFMKKQDVGELSGFRICDWLVRNDPTEMVKTSKELLTARRNQDAPLERKSYVISSSGLKALNEFARKLTISRDELVEWAVMVTKLLIDSHNNDLLEKQKKALELIKEFEKMANEYQRKESMLFEGYEWDPIREAFSAVMMEIEQFRGTVEDALETGVPITRELKVWG